MNLKDIYLELVAGLIGFPDDDFICRDQACTPAYLDIYVAVLVNTLNDGRKRFGFLFLIFFINCAALRFTNALHDNSLCRLGGNPAEIAGVRLFLNNIAKLKKSIDLPCVLQ